MRPKSRFTGRRRRHSGAFCPEAKLPKMDALKAEYQKLAVEKRAAYKEYRAVRKDMQEVVTAKENIDRLFGLTDAQKSKEMER